ncbi:hypothetical protein [Streptomyces parvus]|uniref:hypothetical protein n=1 Tax=Streptomyces parvus TaxID=66428 RepID=UPI0037100D66
MKANILRVSAATAMAAVAFGVAAPAASAAEHQRAEARIAATVGTEPALGAAEARALLAAPEFSAELAPRAQADLRAVADGTATEAQQLSARASIASTLWKLIKKAGPGTVKAAKKAAGKYSTFRNWVNDLPWYNPIKLAWQAAGAEAQYQMWKFVHDQF